MFACSAYLNLELISTIYLLATAISESCNIKFHVLNCGAYIYTHNKVWFAYFKILYRIRTNMHLGCHYLHPYSNVVFQFFIDLDFMK